MQNTDTLPFLANCRTLRPLAPLKWISLGWRDMRRAPGPSIILGTLLVLCSYAIAWIALTLGNVYSLMALASGFIFLGPILAMAFYEMSRQLQLGRQPTVLSTVQASLQHLGDQLVFTLILLVIFLIWARAASMIHIFFPAQSGAKLSEFALFLGVGSAVGSLFAALVFCVSAFSLPMMVAHKTDSVTALVTSFNAVLRNKVAMSVWASLIVAAVGAGLITGFIGLGITIPLIGHATWHAFQETIDASQWPSQSLYP